MAHRGKKETDFGEESPAVSCPTSLFLLSDLFTDFQVRWQGGSCRRRGTAFSEEFVAETLVKKGWDDYVEKIKAIS